ncbi:MAG: hypothetical protein IJZ94_06065 [Clostridia bacterium]|nr:hypothetical protein [Clostridia bacterium]
MKAINYGGVVFNPNNKGYYGGDQGSPKNASKYEKDDYKKIIEKNNPGITLSAEQLKIYLDRINSEGCGYVALVNTIFCRYADEHDAFEKAFGYSMYTDDGQLNYNKLLVDLYSKMDNRKKNGSFDKYDDYDSEKDGPKYDYDYWNDAVGTGTSQDDREYYLEEFMEERGVDVDVKTNVNVTAEIFKELSDSGKYVIIAFRNGNLYNMSGDVAQVIEGGHAMVVTGVTDDSMLIVSSWGNQYYIDPDEKITVTYDDGSLHETSMTFSTVQYK